MSPGVHFRVTSAARSLQAHAVGDMAAHTPSPQLWTAVSLGRTEMVLQILAEEVDIEESGGGPGKSTPLQQAAHRGNEEICRLLIDHKADVSAKDTARRTPLQHAFLHDRATAPLCGC